MNSVWHIVTGEYPPVEGGVGDYVFALANELSQLGDEVHVWCPSNAGQGLDQPGVQIHPEFGRFRPGDCRRVGRQLTNESHSRRLLVQWVPQTFGLRGANLPFCLWILWRSIASRDVVELMVHEPFLRIGGSLKQRAAAVAQRLMVAALIMSSSRVWVSTPYWWALLRPFAFGRRVNAGWLPLPSNVPLEADPNRIAEIRSEVADSTRVVGHFGLFGPGKDAYLIPFVEAILDRVPEVAIRLVGVGSTKTRQSVVACRPDLGPRMIAVDGVQKDEAVCNLAACDLLVQPYVDGISTRRTSAMAGLALGVATVTHSGESTETLWRESQAVVLAGPTPDDYAEAVAAVFGDPVLRTQLSERASDLYQKRFHIRYVIERLRSPIDTARPAVDEALLDISLDQGVS
ncbi:MAG: glycosyltransferase family 4 protein [Blastocatellia bacterium]|nr:glycosyltransferase family 4 protein [Blastocatellia bacterium]